MFRDIFTYYTCVKYLGTWCIAMKKIAAKSMQYSSTRELVSVMLNIMSHLCLLMIIRFLRNGDLNKVRYLQGVNKVRRHYSIAYNFSSKAGLKNYSETRYPQCYNFYNYILS